MLDINKICRSCKAKRTNLLNLFATDYDNEPTLGEKYSECTSINIEESDGLPPCICYSCAKLLETVYGFRKQCLKIDAELRTNLNQLGQDENVEADLMDAANIIYIEDEDLGEVESIQTEDCMTNLQKPIIEDTKIKDIKEDRPHNCLECDKKFFTERALELHKILHRKQNQNNIQSPTKNVTIIQEEIVNECTSCQQIFESQNDLQTHQCGGKPRGKIQCDICKHSFNSNPAYKMHMLTHKENRPYSCEICSKKFSDHRYLYRHNLYHKKTVFKCTETDCERVFKVKHKLAEHLRRYHHLNLSRSEIREFEAVSKDEDTEEDPQ